MKNRGKGVNKDMFEVYMQNSATEYSITRTLRARLARALGIFQQKNIRVHFCAYDIPSCPKRRAPEMKTHQGLLLQTLVLFLILTQLQHQPPHKKFSLTQN